MCQFFRDGDLLVTLSSDQHEMLENWSALSKKQKEIILMLIKSMPTQDD
jgi:hypothetical protein